MDTTNPVYYQNTAETVSLDNLPTGQISWNTWQYLWSPKLSTRDTEYLNRQWREETATAFTDAKKYAAKKAEQWITAAERLKLKERNKPSTLKKPNRPPPKGGGAPKGIKQASREQSPTTSIPNERLLKLQRREIQRKRPRLKRPRLRKLENHLRRPDKLSRSIHKLDKHKRILNAKLFKKRKLLRNSSTNDSDIKDPALNLSSSPISTDELSVQGKGLVEDLLQNVFYEIKYCSPCPPVWQSALWWDEEQSFQLRWQSRKQSLPLRWYRGREGRHVTIFGRNPV